MDHALRDVYVACDAAAGRLIDQAGERTSVMVFALHGMGTNPDRTPLLPEMLARILEDRRSEGAPVGRRRITDRLRGLVPGDLRGRIKQRLPRALQDRLTLYWRANRQDWSRTQAFVAFCDLDGYVRINLRGREREGIVPIEDYRPLCERIASGISTFRDADTGEPIVAEIDMADHTFGNGPMRDHLPDLVIRWVDSPAASHRAIASERYGSIPWPTPGRHPAGRGGNHRREGFLIAGGEAFQRGQLAGQATILDLAPTALHLLGVPAPPAFRGRSLLPGAP
jgi:predicted AlkP superfamily phosphohydrolase/phosphomutase